MIEKLQLQVSDLQQQVSSYSSSTASTTSTAPSSAMNSSGTFRMTAFGVAPVPEAGRVSDVDVFGDWNEKPALFHPVSHQQKMPSF
jgi:hypothetical protein